MTAPIFIAAPVRRSGTTLLQRLCTGSGEALIFGESAANDLFVAAGMLQNKQQMMSYNGDWRDNQLREVLDGKVNQWIPDLLPEVKDYLGIHEGMLRELCAGFARSAANHGRPRWGVKFPEWPTASLHFLQAFFPESKTIYVVRDFEECLASARKMEMVRSEQDETFFRNNYDNNLNSAREHLHTDQTYFLDYALLTGDEGADELKRLADFLELKELPESVLQVRVGDYAAS